MKKPVVAFLLVLSSVRALGQGQRSSVQPATKPVSTHSYERLSGDSPKTTVLGNAFIAPKDWSIRVEGPATILEAPEGNSCIALVDVQAKGPEEAPAAAWQPRCFCTFIAKSASNAAFAATEIFRRADWRNLFSLNDEWLFGSCPQRALGS